MNVIEIKNLTKMYGKARGIEDVSFNVEEGEIFGFIGPNGAGKSTTIRTLLSLIYPTSGSATIFGKDIITAAPEIKKDIGYLPSEVFYYDNMKVMDLLKYSASFYKKDCTGRIKELADIMELDLTKKIDDLSLGNKKKVGIVQGLLHEPKLIILDEPTSGLDPLMQQKFFDLLEKENKKGATILFSSHILSEVQRLCDRVAIIKDGRIVTVEKISTLKENTYKKFKIESNAAINKELFNIEGVNQLQQDGPIISFLFRGNVNSIMKKIAEIEIANLWVEEPDLEEIFMHYYEKEE
ncbi:MULTISPECIES: ABC transporter ATP-binding protein [unclassified Mesobacillus]|uniref:ABC transporter ATP-binding protein n=1 Tax=unclassified Mesobacillus TaxID=2675270 RepID=UPI002040A354|nr:MULTISPECIES: ABC transporter ATP-binding protein [unclassified Mesobacillus]MCM3125054.1 ABC transporter ATP-binding protein [Mesobacillus sp. MER 33]MCM3235186.1 ABC transporter ATP-binding protein [Mesobacillus sp. MER 48]